MAIANALDQTQKKKKKKMLKILWESASSCTVLAEPLQAGGKLEKTNSSFCTHI